MVTTLKPISPSFIYPIPLKNGDSAFIIEMQSELLFGALVESLLKGAAIRSCDMIVMGTCNVILYLATIMFY